MEEQWVDIQGYEQIYQVSNKGRIRRILSINPDGTTTGRQLCFWWGVTSHYNRVRLYKQGIGSQFTVHRVVARHFLPTWQPDLEVNHIDGNKSNNEVSNLEMCTRKENVRHSIMMMLKNDYGEKSKNAKLTNIQADQIRKLHRTGTTQVNLSVQFRVSTKTINKIINYKRYYR